MLPFVPSHPRPSVRVVAFCVLSALMHLGLFFVLIYRLPPPPISFKLPVDVEFGLAEKDPGTQESAPAGAPAKHEAPPKPQPQKPAPRPKLVKPTPTKLDDGVEVVADAGVRSEVVAERTTAEVSEQDDAALIGETGSGSQGTGLGFGSGGFGNGSGNAVGGAIGLHADLESIANTALILETKALLQLIPEWQKLLQGSGINPLKNLSRVFVATPSLRRSDLVVSARFRGGPAAIEQAAARLAQEHGQSVTFHAEGTNRVAPWYSRGPTEREVAFVAPNQIVIARPRDIPRVAAVSAALARRHSKQPKMEQATGAAALLAMYEGEAVALSIEGMRKFVPDEGDYVPLALRISLFPIDQYFGRLRVFGYYESEKAAGDALEKVDALRLRLAQDPQVAYFYLKSALEDAKLERTGDTLVLETKMTMHQIRYAMSFVSRALRPRD